MATKTFLVAGIDPAEADRLRAAGGVTYVADSKPGYPCRQCLRDAEIGDEMLLVSYDPFTASSPYRCASPIFIHSAPCAPDDQDGLPVQLTCRTLSVRGFDDTAMMLDAALIEAVSYTFGYSALDRAGGMLDSDRAVCHEQDVLAALRTAPSLSDEQVRAVVQLATSGTALDVVTAPAGAGKTFAFAAAREAWDRGGFRVIGVAHTRVAADELSNAAGIPSTTIARLLIAIDRGEPAIAKII